MRENNALCKNKIYYNKNYVYRTEKHKANNHIHGPEKKEQSPGKILQ